MLMVREGARPRRELAVCCKVEVMKGARGARAIFVSLMLTTFHSPFLPSFRILSVSSLFVGSTEHEKMFLLLFLSSNSAMMVQKVTGLKSRISRSRSIIMRKAGDC